MLYNSEDNDVESDTWIQSSPSYILPSIIPQWKNSLPDLPLQHSVSLDMQFFSDFDKQEEDHTQNSNTENLPQSHGLVMGPSNEKDTQHKRSRQELHSTSERRRRSRINGKLKDLHQLLPHCNKTDRASILDEAVKYITSLKQQFAVMNNVGSCMPWNPAGFQMQWNHPGLEMPFAITQQATGMRPGYYVACAPCFQLPFGVVQASSPTTTSSFCVPTTTPASRF